MCGEQWLYCRVNLHDETAWSCVKFWDVFFLVAQKTQISNGHGFSLN